MAFFMDPGAMFLGCLGTSEQKFLVKLIETAAKNGYTRFVEPCAGTFAMSNLAVQNGFKPSQIECSDVAMMPSVLGYAITEQSLEPLEIHAQGFTDEELLDPATALYAQLYLRTSKNAGNEYFYNILMDLKLRREEHIASINQQIETTKNLLHGMSYRPMDMWKHLDEVLDDPHAIVIHRLIFQVMRNIMIRKGKWYGKNRSMNCLIRKLDTKSSMICAWDVKRW